MGFLSKLFGGKQNAEQVGSVQATMYCLTKTPEQVEMLCNGYKRTVDDEIFPPDTVWVGPRSKVYHYLDSCCGYVLADGTIPLPESEALRLGLHRCKKCDWHGVPVPEPGTKSVSMAKPVSRIASEPIRRKQK